MAFCSQCGARINETVKFCPKCGAKVIEEISANGEGNHIDNTIRQNAENADITPNKGNKAKLFIGVSLSIMAIALLCVFWVPAIFNNEKMHADKDVPPRQIGTTETKPATEKKPEVINSTEAIYKEIQGTWERVEPCGVVLDDDEPEVKFYFDVKFSLKFSDEKKGVIEFAIAETEKSLEKKAYEYSKELYNSILDAKGVTNYSAFVTPTGVGYDEVVQTFCNDIIYPEVKTLLTNNSIEYSEPFKYTIKNDTIYNEDGSKLGDYYIVGDCLYIKSDELGELLKNEFGGYRGDYISFEKSK